MLAPAFELLAIGHLSPPPNGSSAPGHTMRARRTLQSCRRIPPYGSTVNGKRSLSQSVLGGTPMSVVYR